MQQTHINIAFHIMDGDRSVAGEVYLKNILHALRTTLGKNIGLYIIAPVEKQDSQEYINFADVNKVIFYNPFEKRVILRRADQFMKYVLSRDVIIERIIKEYQICALFGGLLIYKYPKTITLSFLPDFQHIYLPEMFSAADRSWRDQTFMRSARVVNRVILASETVRKDFMSFAPMYAHKAVVLNPISFVPPSIYSYDSGYISKLYNLPDKFVYFPSQFWKHKNHELVFKAVKILKDKGTNIFIVTSGYPGDFRYLSYFTHLCRQLSLLGIRNQIIYIGLVPREHVFLLMRQSICVLNPSLFEGWSIVVDEARSLGKQLLLSDIPVHHEHNLPKATFFDPCDPDALAAKLEHIWHNTSPGPDIQLEAKARQELPERTRALAESFISIIQEKKNKNR